MRMKVLSLLAVVFLALEVPAASAAGPVELTLPFTFKTTLAAGTHATFAFSLYDSGGTKVWTESKAYVVPVNKTIAHRLGSKVKFDNGIGGPVDFSRQLTGEAKSGTFVYRSKLALAPYALWSADTQARSGSLIVRGLDGQTDSLQEWLNSAGVTLAAVAADGTISSSGGFVGDGSGLTNLYLGTSGNQAAVVRV
ncbi:MAG TPA: hypothetical protein VN317_00050, partial [Candidatus Methanoperedens sp.]|nr:hypothetical protein [Candidatus Methanoperedens sp.]